MKLLVKNMVSKRCIMAVKQLLSELHIHPSDITLGEIELSHPLSIVKQEQLKKALLLIGLELVTDKKSMLIEKIKSSILELVHYSDEPVNKKYSCFLSEKLKYDYTYLSNIFKKTKGICIEDYIIAHKIERVKQLLVYSNMSLTEISYHLNYSSVGHLSNQFKKVTGITTRDFKQSPNKQFIPLEVL
ncbi:helix-turn-helix domain-containing protein [Sediminibacterium soli]|uniref:helix-turn-helix domain-containing protein n=1 Tax=Sediminibacterium soli TaxID=2698829 RepID=UPI00137A6071|nr:AraC family transcriptional regulator [Sediminibacterium soli]NCI45912.1 helix-turn-helix transcriptional regulator [Sediminibacterium soli]